MRIQVTNRHNGQKYPAEATLWAEHGWHMQIHDLSPNTWGRASSGIGVGSVIDQGWQRDLERRGWEFPAFSGGPNIRDQEMKRLASTMQRPKESLVDQLIPAPPAREANSLPERNQHEIGTKLEKEHFRQGKPKDKTPGQVADTHLRENPQYYPTSRKPKGSKEALRWVKSTT
jgi:hypothetical protein